MSQIHDKTFKRMLEINQLAEQFAITHLPKVLKSLINLNTLKNEKCDFIEADLKAFYTDVLLSFELKNRKPGLLFFLIEHQTRNDPLMALRLFRYTCSVLEHYAKIHNISKNLPVVFPVVFFTGTGVMKTDIYDLFADQAMARQFSFQPAHVINVHHYTRNQLLSLSPDVFFMTELFSCDQDGNNKILSLCQSNSDPLLLERLSAVDNKVFEIGIQYIIKLIKNNPDEVLAMLNNRLPEKKEVIMNTYDQLILRGELKGELQSETKALVGIISKLNLPIDEAATVINASPEAIQQAKAQLKLK